ncbi:MAG: hypothetical protein ACYTF3_13900, partial [Planctomycetota bacterium]
MILHCTARASPPSGPIVLETRVQIDVSAETASNRSLEWLFMRVSVRTMKLETLCPVSIPDNADLRAFLTQEVECGP